MQQKKEGEQKKAYNSSFNAVFFVHNCKWRAVGESIGEFAPLAVQEGLGTQSEGFPAVLFPISVRTEIGCPARHERKINWNFKL